MMMIKRDDGFSDKITFSLRLIDIELNFSTLIKDELEKNYKIKFIQKSNTSTIIINDIDNYSEYSFIIKLINKYSINIRDINFFFTLSTGYDMSGFTVPKKVSDLHTKIGGTIDFSIINYSE